jgi:Fe-S cluster assembly protein SufD
MNAVATPSPALARLRDALPGTSSRRAARLERLLALGLPTTRDEAWKYANLRLLERRVAPPAAPRPVSADALAALLPDDLPGARLVFVDGRRVPALDAGARPEGLRVQPLPGAPSAGPDASLVPEPTDDVDDRVRLLNAALLTDGLHVVAERDVAGPLHLVYAGTGGGAYPRVVVEVAPGAALTLVEHHVTLDDAEAFAAPVLDVRLAAGASLDHYRLQFAGARAVAADDVLVRVARDARYVQHLHAFGGQYARADVRVVLAEPGAEAVLNGLFFADGARHLDLRVLVDHAAPHTTSEQVFRGVGAGRGRGAYDGKVLIRAGASKASSQQSSRNLLLSPQAQVDARPQLEIHTDDVKAGHGATTGALDENMLFYLLSRGLDRATARGVLTFAFAEDVVARVRIPALRRRLERRVLAGLPDAALIREIL